MQDAPADTSAQPSAPELREAAFTRALGIIADIDIPAGCALAATGSLARGELTPQSDIDLMLLHTGPAPAEAADIWYPVWDAHIRLDHSVRTPGDCVNIVAEDTTAALGLLDLCHLAGDEDLVADARRRVLHGVTWCYERVTARVRNACGELLAAESLSGIPSDMTPEQRQDLESGLLQQALDVAQDWAMLGLN